MTLTPRMLAQAYVKAKFLSTADDAQLARYQKWCQDNPKEDPIRCPVVDECIQELISRGG